MVNLSFAGSGTLETEADAGTEPADIVAYWLAQDKLAESELKDWQKRGRKIVKRYRDERSSSSTASRGSKFNALWANIQLLKPVLYARTPKPDIAPRWLDTEEEVVRIAALILERSLTYLCDRYDIDGVLRSCVEDRLLPGLGTARVRYMPTFGEAVEDPSAPEPEEGEPRATYRPVESEKVSWEYVFWEDIAWGPARRWEEVPWVRFRSYMTRDELVERFGATIGKAVPLDYTPKGMEKETMPAALFKKATVLEFWDKTKKRCVWIAKDYDAAPLDTLDDPLGLHGFFPCPKPLLATTTNDKLVPVPDFVQYQDQADQLDIIAGRIDKLTAALRVAGVYAASEKATLQQLIDTDGDNKLIPVEDWAMFAQQKGGLEGMILWLPIKDIAEVLMRLYEAFEHQKQFLYEVTGLSDVMRGATDPDETAKAQGLKSQYGSVRVKDSQKEVGRFARDLFRIAGEVISEHLDPKTISEITGLPELPQPVAQPTPPMPQLPQLPPQMPAMQPGVGAGADPGAPQPQVPPPQVAPAPSPMPSPPSAPSTSAAQPGAGATPDPSAATLPAPSAPDDPAMAQYQQDLAAFNDYQKEVQTKLEQFAGACQLLRQDSMRTFRLDIEADSTIALDENSEQQSRVAFATAIGELIQKSAPLVQAMPQAGGALVSEVIKFVTHGFRAGRPLEETIDKFADALDKLPPPSPHTDPALVKVQAQAELEKMRLAGEQQIEAARLAGAQKNEEIENNSEIQRAQIESQRLLRETAMKEQAQAHDHSVKIAKIAADERVATHAAGLAHQRQVEEAGIKLALEHKKLDHAHELRRDDAERSHQLARETADRSMAHEKEKLTQSRQLERDKAGLTPPKRTRRKVVGVEKGDDGRIKSVDFQDEPVGDEPAANAASAAVDPSQLDPSQQPPVGPT